MSLRFVFRALVPIAALGIGIFSARAARATTCSTDTECPKDFECTPTGDDSDAGGVCNSLSCKSDSDCGPAFRCDVDIDTECRVGADGGQSCGPGNACVPQWQAPCSKDEECGPGFTCTGTSGYYDCGPKQDAVIPPYATTTTIACSDVSQPADPCVGRDAGCLAIPSICDAGTSCIQLSWKTCVAQATGPCDADSDCPSTWACQCPEDEGSEPAILPDASVRSDDAGCTKACVPPNSRAAFGGIEGASTPSVSSPGTANPADASSGGSTGAQAVSGAHGSSGGCQIQAGDAASGASWIALMALGCAARIRRRRTPHSPESVTPSSIGSLLCVLRARPRTR